MTTRSDRPQPPLIRDDSPGKNAHGARSFRRWEITPNINVQEAQDWEDLKARVQRALDDIAEQVSIKLSIIGRNINEDGMIVGGLGHEIIKGRHFHQTIIDEYQTMGSTLSNKQWIML